MNPRGWRGTWADIVPTHIKFGVDPSTRCWDIAEKPKWKNSPLTRTVTKITLHRFSAPRGPLTPKRGEDTSGTRVRPDTKFGVNRPAGCREIVDGTENRKTEKSHHHHHIRFWYLRCCGCPRLWGRQHLATPHTQHTLKQIPRPSLYERMAGNKCVSRTDTNPPFAFQIAFPRGTDFTVFLQGGSKSYIRCL